MTELNSETAALRITKMNISLSTILFLRKQGVITIGDGLTYLYSTVNERLRGKKQKKYESWFTDFMMDLAYRNSLPDKLVNEIYSLIFTYPLDWLQCFQEKDGSWENDLDQTIAAALTLIRAGNTAKKGRYAFNVARAIRWLEREHPLTEITTIYGLARVLGEHYDMAYPDPPFDLPIETSTWTLEEVRRWAILKGHAPHLPREIIEWSHWEHDRTWEMQHLYTNTELAWMTVGAPRPITR
jgi:hypothetical protein